MNRRCPGVIAFLLLLAAALPAAGESAPGRAEVEKDFLRVEVGDYAVRFWQKAAWTLASVDYRGKRILSHTGAYQTVLRARGEDGKSIWIGTGHGGEEVHEVVLEVDGASHEISEGLAVEGGRFTVVKTSTLGAYHHTSRVHVSADGILQDFDYEVRGEPLAMDRMYAFMHCFNNETRPWIAGLGDGSEERGEFGDDNSFTLKKDIRWALVYAPTLGVGMAYAYPEVYVGDPPLRNALWNRATDNKLYLSVLPTQERGARFNYRVRLKGFAADEPAWEPAGREALADVMASWAAPSPSP